MSAITSLLHLPVARGCLVWVAALASVAAGATDTGRLDEVVVPRFQAIQLSVDADAESFSGSARIELEVRETAESFRFHADGLSIESLTLRGAGGEEVEVRHREAGIGLVAVDSERPVPPGAYALEVRFSGEFGGDALGLYRAEAGGHRYVFTQFEPSYARRAFPCWDEPSFKIPYQLTVRVPEAHTALSNTPVESETLSDGVRTVRFTTTKPLPSYLLAIATGPLDTIAIPGLSVPGRVVTPKGQTALAHEAIRMTPAILAALERWFGSAYPFEKLDLIAVPDYLFGGMENPGAVTFRDSIVLLDPGATSVPQRRQLASIVAHELAHMWFGNLVTMAWWDDLWLNESFASWIGDRIADELYPQLGMQVAGVKGVHNAMSMDSLLGTGAIRQPVRSDDNLLTSDIGLAYEKGRAVLEMVESWVGRETFRKGVLGYLAAHAWGNARGGDLWSALSKASGKDVAGVLATFLDQSGVPIVRVETLTDGRIRLTQKRCLLGGARDPHRSMWRIPMVLRFADEQGIHEAKLVLDESTAVVELRTTGAPDWVYPNAGESGYYRWTVSGAAFDRLAAEAPAHLSPRERVGFVSNVSALVWTGDVRGDTLLRLTAPFAADPEPEVVSAVLSSLAAVRSAFVPSSLRPLFASYVRSTLGPALDRIGWSRTEGEPETVTALRPELITWLGETGRDPRAIAAARTMAKAYLESPTSVDPTLVDTALRLSALEGDQELFALYRKRFEEAKAPTDRIRFLSALGAFEDPKLFDEALAYTLSAPLQVQEMFSVPSQGVNTEERQDRVFRWMMDSYPILAERLPAEVMAFMPFVAGGCSAQRLAIAEKFFSEPSHNPPGTEHELAKVRELVERCVELRARDGAAVSAYLEEFSRTDD